MILKHGIRHFFRLVFAFINKAKLGQRTGYDDLRNSRICSANQFVPVG